MYFSQLKRRWPKFQAFIQAGGGEWLEPTNEWELARFRAAGVTGVVYRNKAGLVTTVGPATEALKQFIDGRQWSAGVATKRKKHPARVQAALARDGDACFLCGKPLGDDITEEHVVPVAHGGPNHISNIVLAHEACNQRMGHLSAMEKIRMREQARAA